MTKNTAAALSIIALLASSGVAFAQTTTPTTVLPVQPKETQAPERETRGQSEQKAQQMMLQVGPNGRVLLRGTVDAVSAGSITVKSWGGDWTVAVAPSTQIVPQGSAITDFKTGDFVGVQGFVNPSASLAINADMIRDWSSAQAAHQEAKMNKQAAREQMKANRKPEHRGAPIGPRTTQGTTTATSTSGAVQ